MKGDADMEDREHRKTEEHNCQEHVHYDGGRKINRDGVRIWVETYTCRLCGKRLDVKEEILD
jgi:predicted SprT family Zn-dependent metalloprotease